MNRTFFCIALLLPGMAFAGICKTVGDDGVVSFVNVPGTACPAGSMLMDYDVPAAAPDERIRALETGVSGREIPFAGYRSIAIVFPEDNGIVRESSIAVRVELQPALRQSHFITVSLDGKAYRGRYGSAQIELSGLERGTHRLRAQVSDAKGKILTTSATVSFTLQQTRPRVSVQPITGDNYIDRSEAGSTVAVSGTYKGTNRDNAKIVLRFPASGWSSPVALVDEEGNWTIDVPGGLLAREASFEAVANVTPDPNRPEVSFEFKTTSTHSVDPSVFKQFSSTPPVDYSPARPADYAPSGQGISTTPGRTNPAFAPNYGR